MEYRILPRSGWRVSAISYGCMLLSFGHGATAQRKYERLLQKAVDLGINFFDTADLYDQGQNEIVVGKALTTKRKELYIATKVGNQLRPDGSGWNWNPRKDYILNAVDESLKRLGTDYIDLYQLHGGTIDDPIDETIEAFEILKEQGKIRAYGISSIRPNVIREYVARSNMVSVMMQYSLLDRRPEESCLPLLEENNIGVLVRGAVAQGLLVDKPAKEYLGYSVEQTARAREAVVRISSSGSQGIKDQGSGTTSQGQGSKEGEPATSNHQPDKTPAQTALQFALKGPAIYSVAAGMSTEEQLVENAETFDAPEMSEEEYRQLQRVLEPKVYEQHR